MIEHRVLTDTYQDSVKLMQLASDATDREGVVTAQAVMATTANKERLREAGLVAETALETAGGNDLVLAVEAADAETAQATLETMQARHETGGRRGGRGGGGNAAVETAPRTVGQALAGLSNPAVGLVSVPGAYAVREAWKLLHEGVHVQIFSDGVDLAAERRLKRYGRETGQLVMGPDCGTAVIDGLPLGFANELPRGPVGIVAASGTGLQEVSTLLAGAGYGVSQAIGVGGRDLHDQIGGLTALAGLERLDADAGTEVIALVSKPPGTETARRVHEAVRECTTPVVVHFQGDGAAGTTDPTGTATGTDDSTPTERDRDRRLETTATLAETATRVVETLDGASAPQFGAPFSRVDRAAFETAVAALDTTADRLVGLFSGGTLCTEAALLLSGVVPDLRTNVGVGEPIEEPLAPTGNALIDLGTDALTRGRPHPMLDPSLRDRQLAAVAADERVGIVLLDVVLGHGVHDDPVAGIVDALADRDDAPVVIASVCGTDADPQSLTDQIDRLEAAGVWVADSNAAAARLAGHAHDRRDEGVTG